MTILSFKIFQPVGRRSLGALPFGLVREELIVAQFFKLYRGLAGFIDTVPDTGQGFRADVEGCRAD